MVPPSSLHQQQHPDILVLPHSKAALQSARSSSDDFTIGTRPCSADEQQQQLDDDDAAGVCKEPFTPSMVAAGLSQLGRAAASGGGCSPVFQRLDIANTDLATPAPLAHCQHLQVLVLHHNALTTLASLSALRHLTRLQASHNRLTQALNYSVQDGSNLRVADLSYNHICELELGSGLCQHTRLRQLVLDGNRIARLQSSSLAQLRALRQLSLCGNALRTCSGLEGLTSLRELSLDANGITSLAALSRLSGLQALTAAHNQLGSLEGVQGLVGLRRLGVACNRLRRIQALAACRGLPLLADLDVAGNSLEAAQHAHLHVVHLLTQLQRLNGAEVSVVDKAEAGNLVGAATDDLVGIRRQFFPQGELEDGGGAVPPTAAGLKASRAEEEAACDDPAAMLDTMSQWAKSVPPALALQPAALPAAGASLSGVRLSASQAAASTAPPQWQHIRRTSSASSSGGGSSHGEGSRHGSVAGAAAAGFESRSSSANSSGGGGGGHLSCAQGSRRVSASVLAAAGGVPAIASRLAAGCCKEAPFRELQRLQACYCWVLAHIQVPHGACSEEAGADAVTWDSGLPLFTGGQAHEETQLLQEVLLTGFTGTWAECVVQLLVSLAKACSLEAMLLSGYWKAGGSPPGEQLASHNHSWAAVKVNGRWRLLDPVYALIMVKQDQPVPFFTPPEAYIHSHLPFEACWQLLPVPMRLEEWWQRPELSLAFAGAGGRLLCDVKACNELSVDGVTGMLPCLRLCLVLPADPRKRLSISLWDSNQQELASWDACSSSLTPGQLRQSGGSVGALVFQQQVLEESRGSSPDSPQRQCEPGLAVHELWAAFPGAGAFFVKVHMVTEVPGGMMSLAVQGLQQPLVLALRLRHQVMRVKVIVHAPSGDPAAPCSSGGCRIAWLPQPQRGFFSSNSSSSCPALQLLCPQPGTVLEADREHQFEVLVPRAAAVALGSDTAGWAMLQRCSSSSGLFAGQLMLPRVDSCFVAVQGEHAGAAAAAAAGAPWERMLALRVLPPVRDLVVFAPPQPDAAAPIGSGSPSYAAAAALLASLDADGDGFASRRDMLRAFRRDRQLADALKMPARIRAGDGSFDAFLSRFAAINRSGLGLVDAAELCQHLAAATTHVIRGATAGSARVTTAGCPCGECREAARHASGSGPEAAVRRRPGSRITPAHSEQGLRRVTEGPDSC